MTHLPNVKKNSFYKLNLVSGAVALHPRLKDMPLAEGDTTYELKGGFNSQVFVMTGNVAATPAFGSGELKGGYLRTFCTGLSISGSAELPKLNVFNMQEGIFITEPDTTAGWAFPSTSGSGDYEGPIGNNIAVYSSQFDSGEVWLGEYFDGADKSVGMMNSPDAMGSTSLKDVYVDIDSGAEEIFFGGDAFLGGFGESNSVKDNLKKYFSYEVAGKHRVYVRPLKKNRMKGLWTATVDGREGKSKWAVYAPFWKWSALQPILQFGSAVTKAAEESKDATTNNTIFNNLSKSGDFGNPFSTTGEAPLLQSVIEISTTKAKTGGASLRMYHQWGNSTEMSGTKAVENSLGKNFVNPQVAKASLYDIPLPVSLDMGTFNFDVSGATAAATTLSGSAYWDSGSTVLSGTSATNATADTTSGSATVAINAGHAIIEGGGISGAGIPYGAVVTTTGATSFLMDTEATATATNITVTTSANTWASTGSVVSGSMLKIGYQNHVITDVYSHILMRVDRAPGTGTSTLDSSAGQSVTGPVSAGSNVTIYNVDTDLAKSYVSGAHLTDKRTILPELDITMNIAKLMPSPAINPSAKAKYVGAKGRIYYQGARVDGQGVSRRAPDLDAADVALSGTSTTEFAKGGPLRTLLRSVVVTFSSYKADEFDTLDEFIDYGMNRYYCGYSSGSVLGENSQNDTQLCGIVFQRDMGNAETKIEDPGLASLIGEDKSLGHIYAYALPVTRWLAPRATGATAKLEVDLNNGSYGHYGIHAKGGMALIDNSLSSQITDNTGNDAGVKLIAMQPKYDMKVWDPHLAGECSLGTAGAEGSQLCEETILEVSNYMFENGSAVVSGASEGAINTDIGVGCRVWENYHSTETTGFVISSIAGDGKSFTMNKVWPYATDALNTTYIRGRWFPDDSTNVNGAIEPHWVKIPMDTFFTMKFVFDRQAKWGRSNAESYGYGATYSYQDYTTGLPTDYRPFAKGTSTYAGNIGGVPLRCYFEGGLSGSTNLGSPIQQHADEGPSGSNIEQLPYINVPMMFHSFTPEGASTHYYQGFTESAKNSKGMLESWPRHMTIWVNNYRYTKYSEGDSTCVNSLFLGAKYTGSTSQSAAPDYGYSGARRDGADEIAYGNADATVSDTGSATDFYIEPEVEVFVDSIELKYFNLPTANHSVQAGEMSRFITMENNEVLSPITTYTQNTVLQGGGATFPTSPIPTTTLTSTFRAMKGMEHSGKWTPMKPGYNISIGFRDDPRQSFPISGTAVVGGDPGGGAVFNWDDDTFTDSTTDYTEDSTSVSHVANAAIVSGLAISSSNPIIPDNTYIAEISSVTQFKMNNEALADATNETTTFHPNTGTVHDIYLLLNNFSTSQFGRIDQITPSIAWKPQVGATSEGALDGRGTNFVNQLGTSNEGRDFSEGFSISGGTSSNDNRAGWAGHGYTYSPDYAGWAYQTVESGAGVALDGKISFGTGSNTYLSCDGMTQKGFIRLSEDLSYTLPLIDDAGATAEDRWTKSPNPLVAAKIMGVQGSHQMGQGEDAVINSSHQILVDNPQIFSEGADDTYLIYRIKREGRRFASGSFSTEPAGALYQKYQIGFKKCVRLAAPKDSSTNLSDDIIELSVYETASTGSDGSPDAAEVSTGVLYADDGITELCVASNLSELWISPLRYWVNMTFISDNLDYRRSYEAINPINKVPDDTATTALGSTYNEWLYSYNTAAETDKGLSGIYEKPWILGNSETSSLVLTTDYGYGSFDEEKDTGGQVGQATAVLNQYVEADISGIVKGGAGGGMMGGGVATEQDVNFLVELSNQSASKTITLVGDDEATLSEEYLPALVWEFHDTLPSVKKLIVGPAFNALVKDVNLYELTTENLNSLKFTWEEEGDDIWYRMLMIDTVDIKDKYHSCIFHLPLNEFAASTRVGNKPQTPAYKFYDYVGVHNAPSGQTGGGGAVSNATAVLNSIEGLAGYAFRGQAADALPAAGKMPQIAYTATATGADDASSLLKGLTEYTFAIHAIPVSEVAGGATNKGKYLFSQGESGASDGFAISLNTDKKVIATHGGISLTGTSTQLCDGETPLNVIVTYKTGSVQAGRQPLELYVNGVLEDYDTATGTAVIATTSGAVVGGVVDLTGTDTNVDTWQGLLEEVLIYNKRWDILPEGGEYIFNSEGLVEKTAYTTSGKWQTQNAKLFAFDYHNIRGRASDVVAQTNLVGWKVTSV